MQRLRDGCGTRSRLGLPGHPNPLFEGRGGLRSGLELRPASKAVLPGDDELGERQRHGARAWRTNVTSNPLECGPLAPSCSIAKLLRFVTQGYKSWDRRNGEDAASSSCACGPLFRPKKLLTQRLNHVEVDSTLPANPETPSSATKSVAGHVLTVEHESPAGWPRG